MVPYRSFQKYLVADESADAWQIICTDTGCTRVPPQSAYPPKPNRHPEPFGTGLATGRVVPEYQFVYITRGRGFFESAHLPRRDVEAGTVFLLFPGERHAYRPSLETGWDEYWVGFKGNYADMLRRRGVLSPERPFFEIGEHASLEECFARIFEIVKAEQPGFQVELGAEVVQLLTRLHCIVVRHHVSSDDDDLVSRARLTMHQRLDQPMDTSAFASELGVSYQTLLASFKRHTGLSPYQYFLQVKIHRAKELLQDSSMSVKEVAYALHFDSPFHFSRVFKQKAGVSPSEWQRSATPGRSHDYQDVDSPHS